MDSIIEAIKEVFIQREQFIIIGLTGRIGSGCSTTADFLTKPFTHLELLEPKYSKIATTDDREYAIIYEYAKNHWTAFKKISVRDIITTFLLEEGEEKLFEYIRELRNALSDITDRNDAKDYRTITTKEWGQYEKQYSHVLRTAQDSVSDPSGDLDKTIFDMNQDFIEFVKKRKQHDFVPKIEELNYFITKVLPVLSINLKNFLKRVGGADFYTRFYQLVGNNIRASGTFCNNNFANGKYTAIAERINCFIKLYERQKDNNGKVFIVIDSIKNPHEATYLRNRYSAFYLLAMNIDEQTRFSRLNDNKLLTRKQILHADICEYPKVYYDMRREKKPDSVREAVLNEYDEFYGKLGVSREKSEYHIFTNQDVESCIQNADIHISSSDKVGDFRSLKTRLLRYVTLIMHPGIVLPTDVERCMQIAFSAKINSGCISRQVGAAVTDSRYNLRSIGWNDVPDCVVSCLYRNLENLQGSIDSSAYSEYELGEDEATNSSEYNDYISTLDAKSGELDGLKTMFCFKDIYCNFMGQGKNQVHTRALHAEEKAFLNIIKHEGAKIEGGFLFTTSSPCELCAKKSYDLGIKKIYYVEPYPGISQAHVLGTGETKDRPEHILFTGATGRAYMQIYTPVIPIKDELELRGFVPGNN